MRNICRHDYAFPGDQNMIVSSYGNLSFSFDNLNYSIIGGSMLTKAFFLIKSK